MKATRLPFAAVCLALLASCSQAPMTGDQGALPKPAPSFAGKIARTAKESTPDFPKGIEAPKGAPNVLLDRKSTRLNSSH